MNRIVFSVLLALLLCGCRITTTIVGEGRVTSQNGHFNCTTGNIGDCAEDYQTAGAETLVAVPAPGWTFVNWTNCNYVSIRSCTTSFGQNTAGDVWPVVATFKLIDPPVQAATYTYNALGQRMTKTVGNVTTLFQYDLAGNLIAELNSSGQPLRQHIHVGNVPIAQLTRKSDGALDVQYVHTDYLGTPTLLTNQNGNVVADIETMPFGETYLEYAVVEYNKRFPGQYKDAESGLHYNYFRDYDPSSGRYIQSDPIGLEGGLNTYAYVEGNPLMYIDFLGLDKTIWINVGGGRNISDGPTNGNWGGKCWGGGRYSCGIDGPGNAPPVDSLDVCAKAHDMCWARCENEKDCQSDPGKSLCKNDCDKEVASCLRAIDTVDPRNWPKPPPKGTENDSMKFQLRALYLGTKNFFRY